MVRREGGGREGCGGEGRNTRALNYLLVCSLTNAFLMFNYTSFLGSDSYIPSLTPSSSLHSLPPSLQPTKSSSCLPRWPAPFPS